MMIPHDYIKRVSAEEYGLSLCHKQVLQILGREAPLGVKLLNAYTVRHGESRLFIKASPAPSTM